MIAETTAWFDSGTSGLLGGLIGAGIGVIVGGIGGPLAGTLAPQGKAKTLVVGFFVTSLVLGVMLAVVGIVALVMGQPYHVWFVFVMPGALTATITGALLPVVLNRYAQADQRRLEAEELRRS